ncbi:MAG: hypothetical protein OEL86_18645 [Sulfuritalea sp.]|jgi:hypothetical protein|nr:hypothetical protein [Sulfuritalea sp.]
MHITDSQLTLGSQHALEKTSFRETTLERIRGPGEGKVFGGLFEQELNKLMAARLDECAPIQLKPCGSAAERIHDMVETMLAALFGSKSDTRSIAASALAIAGDTAPRDQAAAVLDLPRPRWQITQTERVSETESCEFAASGKVCLADGSTRQFDVGYTLERSEEVSRTVSRTLIDPLVVDRAAPRAALSDTRVDFDLDNDGTLEQMRLPAAGSAFLFLDRNHNGRADNGSELFGPESGNGFAELARLDSDRNGWIDSADPAFADLRLWQGMEEDRQLVQRLEEAGIGALATLAAETPFALKEHGEQVGQMRSSSVWLGETGGAGVVRQIDVSTTPLTDKTV